MVFDTTDGSLVWSDEMCNGQEAGTTVLYISDDGRYIVTGYNTKRGYGTVNFYRRTAAADSETVAKPARRIASLAINLKMQKAGRNPAIAVLFGDIASERCVGFVPELIGTLDLECTGSCASLAIQLNGIPVNYFVCSTVRCIVFALIFPGTIFIECKKQIYRSGRPVMPSADDL